MTDYLYSDIAKIKEEDFLQLVIEVENRFGVSRNPHKFQTLHAFLSICSQSSPESFRVKKSLTEERILVSIITKDQTGFLHDLISQLCASINVEPASMEGKTVLYLFKKCYPKNIVIKKKIPRVEERAHFRKNLARKRRSNEKYSFTKPIATEGGIDEKEE